MKNSPENDLKIFLVSTLIAALLITAILSFAYGKTAFELVAMGSVVTLINLYGLIYAWPLLLAGTERIKPICVILLKFGISIGIVWFVTRPNAESPHLDVTLGVFNSNSIQRLLFFAAGLASILPGSILAAIFSQRNQANEESDTEFKSDLSDK